MRPLRGALAGLALAASAATGQTVTIAAERALVAPGREVAPAVIEVRDGRIASVREGSAEGVAVLHAAVVAAGFIDARTTAGLSGLIDAYDDTDDRGGPVRPELRAEDGFDLADPLLAQALRSGVAVVQSGPGDANSIGGQAAIFLTSAPTVAAATVRAPSAMIVSLTEDAKTTYAGRDRLPTTRMANVALIRQALIDAQRHAAASSPSPDAGHEALGRVLADSLPAWVAARRSDEIATALRVAEEFDLDIVITGATEAAPLVELLAASGVSIVIEPTDVARAATGELTATDAALALHAQRVPFSFASGDVRAGATLLDVARDAVRRGLPADAALAAITTSPASLLGIEAEAGTIEAGRAAHLVLLDGDPFDARTTVRAVLVGGRVAWRAEQVR